METDDIHSVYFIGAGGIGMSALVRYFLRRGLDVGGYDRTRTPLTDRLQQEGAQLHFEDKGERIDEMYDDAATTLVVYTPAIPADHGELTYFRQHGFTLMKRAEVLGMLTRSHHGLCVAGTHGKTTTSTMAAHILHQSHVDCNAFLGGISKNYGTNCILADDSDYVVIEADEFDRSFHHLRPWATVITATDADHLDIYGTKEAYLESFRHYTSLVQAGGALIIHTGLELRPDVPEGVRTLTYSREEGDYHAENIRTGGGEIRFDFVSPTATVRDINLGVPVRVNVENAVAAMALAQLAGATDAELRRGIETFEGVDRRFDFKVRNDRHVFLTDYGHHPKEIEQSVRSVRELYDGKKIAAIFQPHLYTRTRDFYRDFAAALSLLDAVYLCDIYPAREQPIAGVTSQLIYDCLRPGMERHLIHKEDIPSVAEQGDFDVLMMLGAGDADDYSGRVAEILSKR